MSSYFVVLFFVLNFIFCSGKSPRSQDYFQTCSRSDPNFDECNINALQAAIKMLKDGVPALKVLPLDPMYISAISMEQGTGPVSISLGLENVIVHGLSNLKYISAGHDVNSNGNMSIWSKAIFPEIVILSDYKTKGQILILPIVGEGKSNITLKNIRASGILENEIVNKNGKEYLKNNAYVVKMEPKSINFDFGNLFGGDAELGRQMNIFLNQNAQDIFKEFSPVIDEAFGEVLKQITNQIFLQFPYKTIFYD